MRVNQALHCRPQQPLGAIASHGSADRASGRHAHMHVRCVIGLDCQHQQRVSVRLSGPPYPLEVLRSGQPELSLQPRPSGRPDAQATWQAGDCVRHHAARVLPTNPLHVLVGLGSQSLAAAQAAALEHGASIGRGHARPKAVHADTASDLGLIRSLRHAVRSSLAGRVGDAPLP